MVTIDSIEKSGSPARIVVVGTSMGGLSALQVLLRSLPATFPWPVAIVQHRGKEPGTGLCEFLQRTSKLPVDEPEDKDPVLPGHVFLAPRDYHLLVDDESFALSTGRPVWYARPSIDVLFESAADAYGEDVIGVILTGANADGARGLAAVKEAGGMAVVQDPETAEARAMPEAAISATGVDRILPLPGIGEFLTGLSQVGTR